MIRGFLVAILGSMGMLGSMGIMGCMEIQGFTGIQAYTVGEQTRITGIYSLQEYSYFPSLCIGWIQSLPEEIPFFLQFNFPMEEHPLRRP